MRLGEMIGRVTTDDETEKWKKCPFCKSEDREIVVLNERVSLDSVVFDAYFAMCRLCGSRGPHKKNKDLARRAWNTRRKSER